MTRKTLVALTVSLAMLLTMAIPRLKVKGAWGDTSTSATSVEEQKNNLNSFGSAVSAPFRAIGKLFGVGKKRKPISKISDKDIKKFQAAQANRVTNGQKPVPATTESVVPDHLSKGREFLNAGQLTEAIAELSQAVSINPKSGEAQTLLGVAYDRKGLGGLAREAFEAAVKAPDDQAMHLNNLGYLLYRQGEFDDAIQYLKRATKVSPDDARIWNNLAMAQIAMDKFDDAYKSYVHVMGEFDSRVKIARNLKWRGHEKGAIKYFEKAQALKPDSTEVWSELAKLYDATGQTEKAQVARQTVVSLSTVASAPVQK